MNTPFLELLLRLAVISGLVFALWKIVSYVWNGLVDRVEKLEAWRTQHESGHVQVLLEVREVKTDLSHLRKDFGRLEKLLQDAVASSNPMFKPRQATEAGT
ncbi:MAG TPA: hypothetical protein VJ549_00555 [Geothrix sp.]|nr:hypothetical protein [Geothrix sp.]HJV47738.1 hypothetical protein [Geothrix sp.]